jgi:hypothetical protein
MGPPDKMIKNNPGFRILFVILIWLALCVLLLHSLAESAPRLHLEKEYQKRWCAENEGRTEVVLDDRTRVDCLTDTHAIEFDFADEWAQAVGQARLYAVKTRKKPGIVLIIESDEEFRFLWRLLKSIQGDRKQWSVWVVTPEYLEEDES